MIARKDQAEASGLCALGPFAALPDWAKDKIGPPDIKADYARLLTALQDLPKLDVTDAEATVIRVFCVQAFYRVPPPAKEELKLVGAVILPVGGSVPKHLLQ